MKALPFRSTVLADDLVPLSHKVGPRHPNPLGVDPLVEQRRLRLSALQAAERQQGEQLVARSLYNPHGGRAAEIGQACSEVEQAFAGFYSSPAGQRHAGEGETDLRQMLSLSVMASQAEESGFEGWPAEVASFWWQQSLRQISQGHGLFSRGVPPQVLAGIDQLYASAVDVAGSAGLNSNQVGAKAKDLAELLVNLREGDSYCMRGGWEDKPRGHVMVYRFVKRPGDRLSMYVYNAHYEEEQGGTRLGGKLEVKPCYLFEDIPYEKLFFCNPQEDPGGTGRKVFPPDFQPIILKRLLEQLVPPQEPKRRNVHEILDLLSPLAEFLAPSDHVADLYLRLQRTGNCPIKSVRCLLLELMGDKEQYKLLNLDTRFFGLIYFYHKFRASFDTPDGARDLAMLRRAVQNFLGTLRKNYGRPGSLITPDMYEVAFSTANDLLRKLDGHEQKAKAVAPPALPPVVAVIPERECQSVHQERVLGISDAIAGGQVPPLSRQAAVMMDALLGANARWPDLPRIAVELNRILGELQARGDHRQAVIQFEATMMRLAALCRDASMGGIAPDEAKRCLELLDTVFEKYAKSVYETQGLASPRMQNVAMEVVALSWCLSRHIDPRLNDYGLNVDHFLKYQDSPYFNCPDPEVLAHRNDLVAFFNGINGGKAANRILFDFAGVSCSGDDVRFNRLAEIDLYDHYPAELAQVVDAGDGAKLDILPADQNPRAKAHLFASLEVARYPAGLQYLARLKRNACLGYELFRPGRDIGNYRKNDVGLFKPAVIYEGRFRYWQAGLGSDFVKPAELGGEDYPALQQYRDQPVAVIINRRSENQLLLAGAASPEDQDLAVSVPEGQMSALLDVAADSLDKFNEDAWRLRWELECLRPAYLGDRWIFPVEEELKKDAQPMLAKLDHLSGEAYRIFIRSAPPTSPKWKQLLSVVRTRANALYTAKKVVPNYRFSPETRRCHDELITWLRAYSQTADLPEETKKELVLARIGLLLAMPPAELALEDAVDLFNLMRDINSTGAGTLAALESQSFLRECRYRFAISQDLWQQFLPAGGQCPLAARIVGGVDSTYHVDRLSVVNAGPGLVELTGDWSLDLSRAAVLRWGIEVGDVPFELTMEMRRLFDDRKPKIRRLNPDTVQFDDVVWGQNITIAGTGERAKIFAEFENPPGTRRRYRYVSADEAPAVLLFLQRFRVNASLYFGYAHWLSDDGHMLIFSLQDGQHPVCRLEPDGRLVDLRSEPVAYSYPLGGRELGLFSRFESSRFVAVWSQPVAPALADQRVSYLEMPRFSMKGNPLRFDRDDQIGGWVYCADRRYVVHEAPYEPLASRFGRYLDLVDKDNRKKHKVLIPVGAVSSDGFGGIAKVSIPTNASDSSRLSLDYFEYDFNEDDPDNLKPANLEARIYLAHLYLAQKRYQEAAQLLRGVSLSDTLSDKAIILVREILKSSAALSDVSPNACAVRLQALWLLRRLSPDVPVLGEQQNAMLSIYRKYLHGIEHVEEPLMLDLAKEKELFDWFRSPDLAWRLEDFKPAPSTVLSTWRTAPRRGVPEGWLDAGNFTVKLEPYTQSDEPALIALLDWDSLPCTKCYPGFSRIYNDIMTAFGLGAPGRQRLQELVYTLATMKIEPAGLERNQINLLLFVARSAVQSIDFAVPLALPAAPPEYDNAALVAWYKQVYTLWQGSQFFASEDKDRYLAFTLPAFDKRSADRGPVLLPPRLPVPPEVKVRPDELTSFSGELELEQWQESLLGPAPPSVAGPQVSTVAAAIDPQTLSGTERDYQEGIDRSLQSYLGDCQMASDALARRRVLNSDDPVRMLAYALQEHDRRLGEERNLEQLVLLLANRQDDRSLSAAMRQRIERLAKARPVVDLPTVLHAASQGLAALRALNPSLPDGELVELRTLAVDLMIKATQRQHLARLIKPLKSWAGEIELARREARAPLVNPLWRDEVRELLGLFRTYDPYDPAQEDYFPLFFEYLSGMRLWHSQATIIRSVLKSVLENPDPSLSSKVFQRIMAGGKTSVIISSLLEIIAQEGKMSFVLCHHSQYAGVGGNLHNFQESRYHKDVYSLDYSLRDLGSIEVLREVQRKLQEADDKKCAVLMKSSMPQVLELKYVLDTMELGRINRQFQELQACPPAADPAEADRVATEIQGLTRMRDELAARVGVLAGINRAFRDRGVGFFDECDMTLSMLMEVNVPLGESEMISPERAELVRAIYQSLAVDPRVNGLVNLRENRQATLAPEEIRQRIAPVVAEYLFVNYRTINRRIGGEMVPTPTGEMRPRYLDAFIRYLTGRITPAEQLAADNRALAVESLPLGEGRENIEFLRYLAEMHDSRNPYVREAAEQIALARRIIGDVLPLALSHSCNRGYGRDHKQDNGAVIPYLGVNTPAKTRFGYNYLALCYQYQTALNEDITEGEIRFLAEKMVAAAQFYAARDGKNFAETPESIWFRARTGQELGAVLENPALLRAACVHVNASPDHRLAIEAEVAPFHVETARERASSNPINLVEQLGQVVACSGTPWNWQTYHRKVGVLEADRGVEGRIINTMLGRAVGREQEALRTVPDDSLESILRQISSHPQRGRLRSLIDAGGFLKGNNNAQVARAILDLYAREAHGGAPAVNSVVYLHQFSEEEVRAGRQPESFVVLKRLPNGSMQMEVLANTSDEEIARCGVDRAKMFVLFDELRATGTDIKMAEDTICLVTVDSRMPVRTMLQATLRARGYFQGQDCEYLVTAKGRSEMLNGGQRLSDVVNTLIKNQAVAAGEQTFRRYLAHITNSVRARILRQMIDRDPLVAGNIAQRFRRFFVTGSLDSPFAQFARVEDKKETLAVLRDRTVETLANFCRAALGRGGPEDPAGNEFIMSFATSAFSPGGGPFCTVGAGGVIDFAPPRNEDHGAFIQTLMRSPFYGEIGELIGELQGLVGEAQRDVGNKVLPVRLEYQQGRGLDTQVEVAQEREMAVAVEETREVELSTQLAQERRGYESDCGMAAVEREWRFVSPAAGQRLDFSMLRGGIQPVGEVFRRRYAVAGDVGRFSGCFPPNLHMSENLRVVGYGRDIPPLHSKAKRASYVMVVESAPGQLEFVLLTKRDLQLLKERWPAGRQPPNIWLVNLRGMEERCNDNPGRSLAEMRVIPGFGTALAEGLWYANLFNGNVRYLEGQKELSAQKFSAEPANAEMCKRLSDYVLLRAYSHPRLRHFALASKLLRPGIEVRKRTSGVVFGPRRLMQEDLADEVQRKDMAGVGTLPPEQVSLLKDEQFQYLQTAAQVAEVPDDKLKFLDPRRQADLLNPRQIARLRVADPGERLLLQGVRQKKLIAAIVDPNFVPGHLVDAQINLVPPEWLPRLANDQIKKLTDPELVKQWPRRDRQLWRLVMVAEPALGADLALKQWLEANVNGFRELQGADVASWLVPKLSPERVRMLPPNRLRDEVTVAQAAALPAELVGNLLKKEHVEALRQPAQIKAVQPEAVKFLKREQVEVISPGQAQYLTPEQVGWLSQPAMVAGIRHDRDHVAAVPVGCVSFLAPGDENLLPTEPVDVEKVHRLVPRQVNGLRVRALVAALAERQVAGIRSGEVVPLLAGGQINQIDPQMVRFLDPKTQLGVLERPDLVAEVAADRVRFLPVGSRRHIRAGGRLAGLPDDNGLEDRQKDSLRGYLDSLEVGALIDLVCLRPWLARYCISRLMQLPEESYGRLNGEGKGIVVAAVRELDHDSLADRWMGGGLGRHLLGCLTKAQISSLGSGDAGLVDNLPVDRLAELKLDREVLLVVDKKDAANRFTKDQIKALYPWSGLRRVTVGLLALLLFPLVLVCSPFYWLGLLLSRHNAGEAGDWVVRSFSYVAMLFNYDWSCRSYLRHS